MQSFGRKNDRFIETDTSAFITLEINGIEKQLTPIIYQAHKISLNEADAALASFGRSYTDWMAKYKDSDDYTGPNFVNHDHWETVRQALYDENYQNSYDVAYKKY